MVLLFINSTSAACKQERVSFSEIGELKTRLISFFIAMVAALTHSTVLPGKSHALDVSAAAFEGETGVAINYSGRLDENTQVNFGYAGTGFFEENIIRGGIGFQWQNIKLL